MNDRCHTSKPNNICNGGERPSPDRARTFRRAGVQRRYRDRASIFGGDYNQATHSEQVGWIPASSSCRYPVELARPVYSADELTATVQRSTHSPGPSRRRGLTSPRGECLRSLLRRLRAISLIRTRRGRPLSPIMPRWFRDLNQGRIRTDVNGRALRTTAYHRRPAGVSAPVMGHTYPGPGGTIGPAMTFGYWRALHCRSGGKALCPST